MIAIYSMFCLYNCVIFKCEGETMPVQNVSFNSVAFRGEIPKKEGTPISDNKEKANGGFDDKKKIALVLGGLAATGIAAVAIAKKGKKIPSELNIDEFKKIGGFDKGAAKVKGKPFSGTINIPNKDGSHVLEYEKGVLKQSTQFKKVSFPEHAKAEAQMMPVSKKVYSKDNGATVVECWLKNNQTAIFGGDEWGKIGKLTVAEDKSKVTMERINGFTGDVLNDITSKQKDGSWHKTVQEISFDKN